MSSATAVIRLLVTSALAALIVALIVIRNASFVPEQKTTPPVPAPISIAVSPPAPSEPPPAPREAPAAPPESHEKVLEPAQGTYALLPVSESRRTRIIADCFTSDLDRTVPPSARESALVAAALKEDWETVRKMIDAGAPIESADEARITPLMAAAMQGDENRIGMLLKRHANANSTDLSGRSPLSYAIKAGNLKAVQALLPFVSNFESISIRGHELLTMALETGDMSIFQAVLERLPPTLEWTSATREALEAALRADMKEQVRLLLSKHTAPPTPEGGTVPIIAYALARDDAALFHTLLACGSDPNIVIPKGAEKDFMSLIKSKYLRLYIQEETGINLLMLAAGLGKDEYVRALLDAGADRRRSTPREKMLPLYFAAWTENWQCVQMLLGGGPLPDQLRVEISLANQNMAVIKDGVTVYTTHCSTGRQGFTTPAGYYVVTDKDRDHRSTIYKVPMPYFMRLSCRDFGMHEGAVPTYPASHGCIRLPSEAARKLFTEIPIGTVVTIN